MKYYASVCKQTIARNNRLPKSQRTPPIRVSRGKYGRPSRVWRLTVPWATLKCDMENPMPWGAKVWIEWGDD